MKTPKRFSLNASAAIAVAMLVLGTIAAFGQAKGNALPKPKTKAIPPAAQKATPPRPSSDPSKCKAKNGLTLAEINELLAAHNNARSEQKIAAVTWNCRLAELAQEWADKSIYEHRDDSSYGENIFVSGNAAEPIATVVKRWMLEKPNWNNETATCTSGKVCTHYAQVMWRATKSIGCGINRSATGKWKAMVVCNYDPASKASGPAW